MTRKRKSTILEKAQRRLKGLKYLKPSMDLGNGLSAQTFASMTEALQAKLDDYNEMVDQLDQRRAEIEVLEQSLAPHAERILNAVASLYGKDSDEYEIAGGVKRVRQNLSPHQGGNQSPPSERLPVLSDVPEGSENGKNGVKSGRDI